MNMYDKKKLRTRINEKYEYSVVRMILERRLNKTMRTALLRERFDVISIVLLRYFDTFIFKSVGSIKTSAGNAILK